jgi:TPR repeat protein
MAGGIENPDSVRIRQLEADAEAGDLDSVYLLGLIAASGSPVSEPDEAQARELQAWASWHGHIDATFEYSLLLRQGIGGPRDTVTADRLERVAAEAGHPRACLNVGARVHAERGDCEEVAGWYERASLGGSKEAALRLVQMFLRDDGLPRDETVARKWLVHALVLGCSCGIDRAAGPSQWPLSRALDERRATHGKLTQAPDGGLIVASVRLRAHSQQRRRRAAGGRPAGLFTAPQSARLGRIR